MEVSIHDTIDYYANDILYLKIREKLISGKEYNMPMRLINNSSDTVFITKMIGQNITLDLDNYHIHMIAPGEVENLVLRFHGWTPLFTKSLTIYYPLKGVAIIRIRGRAGKTQKLND